MYQTGRGVPQSDTIAVAWWRKATVYGHPDSQSKLGLFHSHGRGGLQKSNVLAAEWWLRAAKQGHVQSQCNLGNCYAAGAGVPQSFSEALLWLRKAQAQGFAAAALSIQQVVHTQRRQQVGAAAAAMPPLSPAVRSSLASPIPVGTAVELHGLKSKELNGKWGIVSRFDGASGRCQVDMEDESGSFKIKPENLRADGKNKKKK